MEGQWWSTTEIIGGIRSGAICDAPTLSAWACLLSRGPQPS